MAEDSEEGGAEVHGIEFERALGEFEYGADGGEENEVAEKVDDIGMDEHGADDALESGSARDECDFIEEFWIEEDDECGDDLGGNNGKGGPGGFGDRFCGLSFGDGRIGF